MGVNAHDGGSSSHDSRSCVVGLVGSLKWGSGGVLECFWVGEVVTSPHSQCQDPPRHTLLMSWARSPSMEAGVLPLTCSKKILTIKSTMSCMPSHFLMPSPTNKVASLVAWKAQNVGYWCWLDHEHMVALVQQHKCTFTILLRMLDFPFLEQCNTPALEVGSSQLLESAPKIGPSSLPGPASEPIPEVGPSHPVHSIAQTIVHLHPPCPPRCPNLTLPPLTFVDLGWH